MNVIDRSGTSRRAYLRGLVAVGGATAISACVAERGAVSVPTGTDDPSSLPERQHAWNETLETDEHGNRRPPAHHVLTPLRLRTDPDGAARDAVEERFRTLERAYAWGPDGLLFAVGYAPAYFDRFDADLPTSVDLPEPTALTSREDPAFDAFDALVHLASDHPEVVLRAEEALVGELDELNGVAVDTDRSDAFDRVDDRRRTGFVGGGLPAERAEEAGLRDGVADEIPEEAPFFMGFRSGFRESQATEDRVTIETGPFAGGTTEHVSSMDVQLDVWYEQDGHAQRVAKTFGPAHADDDLVGEFGEALADSNGLTDEHVAATEADARERGVVGHAQKAARAREGGSPLLLRRDFNTVDGGGPGVHFVSLQRDVADFVRVREAMTGADLAGSGVGAVNNNGILQYLFVNRRGNYLVPPRSLRALPPPDPDESDRAENFDT